MLANSDAHKTVLLTTLTFSRIGMIASFWMPSMEGKLTTEVLAALRCANVRRGFSLGVAKSTSVQLRESNREWNESMFEVAGCRSTVLFNRASSNMMLSLTTWRTVEQFPC
jgi:hypothetical protein